MLSSDIFIFWVHPTEQKVNHHTHVCINTYLVHKSTERTYVPGTRYALSAYLIRTYEYCTEFNTWYDTRIVQPRDRRRIQHTQRENNVRMASLIGSKLAKIS